MTTAVSTLPNGLTILTERMPHVRSASACFLLPAGYAYETPEQLGLAGVLAEMITRGAGEKNSRELAAALDRLGVDHSEAAGSLSITLNASCLARSVEQLLPLYADIILRPQLLEADLAPARDLALQDLQGLEDSPADLCLLALKKCYYPEPYNRNQLGTEATLNALALADVRQFQAQRFLPGSAIIALAGQVEHEAVVGQLGELFRDWTGTASAQPALAAHQPRGSHVTKDSSQTQIALAYPTAPFNSEEFYAARAAIAVLSGGMSSRLFTEVREKRGLCYSVSASYDQVQKQASVVCYAGTEASRAQQTLDVMQDVLRGVQGTVTEEEMACVKAGLKTSLIMQQESTAARASSLTSDWFHLQRVRPFEEIQSAIDRLTPASIHALLEKYPAKNFTVVTLGREALSAGQ